ncbi:chromosome structural maintenance protein 4, partial [Pseudoloma neurophilia]
KKKKLDNNSDEENKSDDYSDSNYSDENNSKKNKTVHDNTKKKKLDNNSDENKILELEKQLKNIQIITVDYNQLKEKKIKCDEFMKYSQFYENISNIFKKYSNSLHQIKSLRHNQFMKGLKTINKYLKVFYQKITFGGNAELELVDISDPFEGINLSIMPPKKTWCKIGSLSGGEKTLSSLSLVFSLHKYRPSSFYIMDEIDAALDYKNVSIIAQLLKEIKSQFIIISLRNNMFEITHRMIGVYKVGNGSRVISVDGGLF